MNITIWCEHLQDQTDERVRAVYPDYIHGALAQALEPLTAQGATIRIATLDMPDCGLPPEVLDTTDVLLWWGHIGHDRVPDELARAVADRVLLGMGFLALHSAHYCKPFKLLMGTTCSLRHGKGASERLWCLDPGHPIAQGVPTCIEIPNEEMYGEFYDIPAPDELVYGAWFAGGELFRAGCCWRRGSGKVFYFQPGHETDASYYLPHIQQILRNAVQWAAPTRWRNTLNCIGHRQTAEQMKAEGIAVTEI